MKHHGTVQWFNIAKGFGYITDDESQQEIFVHYTDIASDGLQTLETGQSVTFETATIDGKEQAVHVQPL
ncbi:MAG: cold shock domain-containing protein [Micrococcaceae bacterium]